MEVTALSGSTTIKLDEEELNEMVVSGKCVRELKTLLATRVGYSRFRQRLFADDMGELRDEMLLSRLPSVQLIILDLHDADDAMVEQLFCACEQGRLTEVEQLLQKPLNPNLRHPEREFEGQVHDLLNGENEFGDWDTALTAAAEHGHLEVVCLLLEAGADKNAAGEFFGGTALRAAATRGHLEVVRLLLRAGADKNAATTDREKALMGAAEHGHLDVVRLLLEAGADGATALINAAFNGQLEAVRLLLEAGAAKNAANTNGETALMAAAEHDHLEVVRLLLKAGADKNAATTDGETALMRAAHNGHLEVVRLLLEAGAGKNAANTNGETALIGAAKHGHLIVARLLLQAGADKNAAATDGETALILAAAEDVTVFTLADLNGPLETAQFRQS
ncbi:unnamed protein product [Durusdinium trenchii]|uniref:Ankyrin repeat domain-containing protein 17 n=1 Tax=Durusdinium trenchii TaxID=1381693 RepID=A0ABP0NK63_9DINO